MEVIYMVASSMLLVSFNGAPLDGSHRSAPANPSLYYRTDDSSSAVEAYTGSHRSAPENPILYYRTDDSTDTLPASEGTYSGTHRSAPQNPTGYDKGARHPEGLPNGTHRSAPVVTVYRGGARYAPTRNAHTQGH